MDSLKEKLTKEEALELIKHSGTHQCWSEILLSWERKGWIKQSALEKARYEWLKIKSKDLTYPLVDLNMMIDYYEQAIKELEDKINDKKI